eukprot:scaffold2011_cov233-Pinguiococcus_pyrenoidosus.AAC.6
MQCHQFLASKGSPNGKDAKAIAAKEMPRMRPAGYQSRCHMLSRLGCRIPRSMASGRNAALEENEGL